MLCVLLRVGARHLSARYNAGRLSPPLFLVAASNHLRGSALFQTAERIHLLAAPSPQHTHTHTHTARGAGMQPTALRRCMRAPVHKCKRRNENALCNELKAECHAVMSFWFSSTSHCVCVCVCVCVRGIKYTQVKNKTNVGHVQF